MQNYFNTVDAALAQNALRGQGIDPTGMDEAALSSGLQQIFPNEQFKITGYTAPTTAPATGALPAAQQAVPDISQAVNTLTAPASANALATATAPAGAPTVTAAPGANATAAEWDAWNQANFGANSAFANQFATVDPTKISSAAQPDLSNLDFTKGQTGKDITEMAGWSMANPGATPAEIENRYSQMQDKNALVTQLGIDSPQAQIIAWGLASQGLKNFADIDVKQENGNTVFYNKATGQPINGNRFAMIGNGQYGVEGGDLFFNLGLDSAGNLTFNPEFSRRRTANDNVVGQALDFGLKFTPAAPFVYAYDAWRAAAHNDPIGFALATVGGVNSGITGGLGTPDAVGSDWATSGAGTAAATVPTDVALGNLSTNLNAASTALRAVQAGVNGQWGDAASLASGLTGAGSAPIGNTGFTVGDAGRFVSIGANIANGQYGNAAITLAPYLKSPNTALAGAAFNLNQAIETYDRTGNIGPLLSAGNTFKNISASVLGATATTGGTTSTGGTTVTGGSSQNTITGDAGADAILAASQGVGQGLGGGNQVAAGTGIPSDASIVDFVKLPRSPSEMTDDELYHYLTEKNPETGDYLYQGRFSESDFKSLVDEHDKRF